MPGLVPLIVALSLDVTRGLVLAGAGLGFDGMRFTNTPPIPGDPAPAALAVVDASDTTPIVVTTALPHLVPFAATQNVLEKQLHAVISGVTGNLAANNVDINPRSFTIGQNLGTICVALTATTLALYSGYDITGALVPISGSGFYDSGGTIVPAFTRGRILMGREFLKEATASNAPPACFFVPQGSNWGPKSTSLPVPNSDQRYAQMAKRALMTEFVVMEIYSWGQSSPPDPALDFDVTQQIYQQVAASTHLLCSGRYQMIDGTWDDQREKATQYLKVGHLHVMRIAYATPVVDAPRAFVPSDTVFDPTTYLQLDDGPPEMGCGG